jgi:hypothetical protein
VKILKKLNTPVAVILLLVLVQIVDGFLAYRYQQALQRTVEVDATPFEETINTAESTDSEDMRERVQESAAFVHRASSQNIVGNSTYLENPSTNQRPDAILSIERILEPGENTADNRPIGVWYDANRGGRWVIFNQDLAPMSDDATFEVRVWEKS